MLDIISIFILTIYLVFGVLSFYFGLVTPIQELKNAKLAVKILYWHGIVFVLSWVLFSYLIIIAFGLNLI